MTSAPPAVVVALHAHPDDETLLTGGTLAALAAEGHRVVLVVATAGGRGLTGDAQLTATADLAAHREAEVRAAAAALGVARVVLLGHADSGDDPLHPAADGFARVPVEVAARQVADVLVEERADILIGYDENGGYGHPDHRHVHEVAKAAAALAGTPRLLYATVDRTWIVRAVRLLAWLRLAPGGVDAVAAGRWYEPRARITHRIPVGQHARTKRAALRCHRSQSTGGSTPRTVRTLLALPSPVFRLVAGTEWFVEPGGAPSGGRVRPSRTLVGVDGSGAR